MDDYIKEHSVIARLEYFGRFVLFALFILGLQVVVSIYLVYSLENLKNEALSDLKTAEAKELELIVDLQKTQRRLEQILRMRH